MITIAGAGVAGLASAYELAKRGADVILFEAGSSPADRSDSWPSSWFAGGMLAPWCEGETADPEVVRLGAGAIDWWAQVTPVTRRGTLVLAPPRDRAELDRFARRTDCHRWVGAEEIAMLEPELETRFQRGLFFEEEAHLDPRRALLDLTAAVQALGVEILYDTPAPDCVDVDCRGMASRLPGLRPVRGEMVVIEAPEVELTRTIRLLHPRIPLYLVPRGQGVYMIGATMIESTSWREITVRSLLELLGAAFALHPALGEASVIETGVGLRPAFADNMPRLIQAGDTTHVNGMYRHGFLLAPALAGQLAAQFFQEGSDECHRERQSL
ncbi:FAD-dependent oxidoreductase [Aliiroseovarius crassostreae]|uniref:FAD-dependent oxidoreductase n=1 Tax=Aliiroseovarius crassostreae TaxID=154981 RepID=UPI0021B0044E|nr:FAD-dependent oxidoreductase [Aliiroseovarius crassostreae]UWQ04946.1 FAD-dependent oxidoreductase [Aliiroseovarius crassostreae]